MLLIGSMPYCKLIGCTGVFSSFWVEGWPPPPPPHLYHLIHFWFTELPTSSLDPERAPVHLGSGKETCTFCRLTETKLLLFGWACAPEWVSGSVWHLSWHSSCHGISLCYLCVCVPPPPPPPPPPTWTSGHRWSTELCCEQHWYLQDSDYGHWRRICELLDSPSADRVQNVAECFGAWMFKNDFWLGFFHTQHFSLELQRVFSLCVAFFPLDTVTVYPK